MRAHVDICFAALGLSLRLLRILELALVVPDLLAHLPHWRMLHLSQQLERPQFLAPPAAQHPWRHLIFWASYATSRTTPSWSARSGDAPARPC